MRNRFAVFILTHGRPEKQVTFYTLMDKGYDGDIYLVVDDTDETLTRYVELFGEERVLVFSKAEYIDKTDHGLQKAQPKAVVFARNAGEDFAHSMGYVYFALMDDDVANLRLRYDEGLSLKTAQFHTTLGEVFDSIVDYMRDCGIAMISPGFTNNYRSGVSCLYEYNPSIRLCAEVFFRNGQYPVDWKLNLVEDMITSIETGNKGFVCFSFVPLQLDLVMSEGTVTGGMSEAYKAMSKFSFYFMPTIIFPSCCSPTFVHDHWYATAKNRYTVPCIISSKYQKKEVSE